ncbi:hypothetical protein BGZ63DRAFT_394970 [Mariannaea sp. PMI_226]|nr:hypothetical protein BGZ63DRAFT_394970 [Mariannaea sp. PMI_226]
MNPQQGIPLLFLQYCPTNKASTGTLSDTVARAHASKQGHLKSARSRKIRFVPQRSGVESEAFLHPTIIDGPSRRRNCHDNRNKPSNGVTQTYDNDSAWLGSPAAPSCRVGSGSWDPFSALAVYNITQEERFMLSYAFTTTWMAFGESEASKRRFAQSWMWRTMESPATFYAQLLGSSTHYVISCPEATIQSRIITKNLHWKIQALQALRHEVERFQTSANPTIADNALLAIFVLAVHGNFKLSQTHHQHPLSPLATYRDMHIYGMMDFGDEHMDVLYNLIEQRGGLPSIDQQTFGYVMPLLDMLYNARLGRKPRFPFYRESRGSLRGDLWQPDEAANQLLETVGASFRQQEDHTSFMAKIQLDGDVTAALATVAEVTVALDHFCRGSPGAPPSLDVLANNCDWASHKLMSINSYLIPENGESSISYQSPLNPWPLLREICRLSSLIYLDMVILPTPPHTKIKYNHAENMLPLILTVRGASFDSCGGISEFLIWATLLGAISSRFTELEGSYLKLLKDISEEDQWDRVKLLVKKYLWWDYVCDLPAKALWLEAR